MDVKRKPEVPIPWLCLLGAVVLVALASYEVLPGFLASILAPVLVLFGAWTTVRTKQREAMGDFQLAILGLCWCYVVFLVYVSAPIGAAWLAGLVSLFLTAVFVGSSFARSTMMFLEGVVATIGWITMAWVLLVPYESAGFFGSGFLKPTIACSAVMTAILVVQIIKARLEGRAT